MLNIRWYSWQKWEISSWIEQKEGEAKKNKDRIKED